MKNGGQQVQRKQEWTVSRSLAAQVFDGSYKILSKAADRSGGGRLKDITSQAWLIVENTSGGRVYKVRGHDEKSIAEAVRALERGEVGKLLNKLSTAAMS